jgi:hypothetical protein
VTAGRRLPVRLPRWPMCAALQPMPRQPGPFLPYACSRRAWHFGGHAAVLDGRTIARWPR